jgi:hypothetical protein
MRGLLARMTGWVAAADGSRPIAASGRRGPVMWLLLCGALLAGAVLVGTVVMVDQFRERALKNAERELENTVLLLTRHFDQKFEDSDIMVQNIISQMEISTIASPEVFRSRMSGDDARERLRSRISALSFFGHVSIFDADGKLINSSGEWPRPDVSIADRAYFKALKSGEPSTSVLAEPVRSYFTGAWTTVVAYRLSGPDGRFLGVMGRRIDPSDFEKFFATVTLGQGAAIAIFHRDGALIARSTVRSVSARPRRYATIR